MRTCWTDICMYLRACSMRQHRDCAFLRSMTKSLVHLSSNCKSMHARHTCDQHGNLVHDTRVHPAGSARFRTSRAESHRPSLSTLHKSDRDQTLHQKKNLRLKPWAKASGASCKKKPCTNKPRLRAPAVPGPARPKSPAAAAAAACRRSPQKSPPHHQPNPPRQQSPLTPTSANTSASLARGKRVSSPPGLHTSMQPFSSSPADSPESGTDLPMQQQGSYDQGQARLGYFQTSSDYVVYTGQGNTLPDDRNDVVAHSTGRRVIPPSLDDSKISPPETEAGTEESPESNSKYKPGNGAGKIAADSPERLSPRTIHRFSSATWVSSRSEQESLAEQTPSTQYTPTYDTSARESAATRETEASRVPLRELQNPRPRLDSRTQAKVLPWETQTLDEGPDVSASPSKEPGKKKKISLGRRKHW